MSLATIETGTVRARRQRVNGFEVSEVVFAPDRRLFWHLHPHTCLAVVTKGAVRKRFTKLEEDAVDGTVVEMPAEERHEDLLGRDGARIVVVESESEPGELRCFRDWNATVLAHRVSRELARPDAYTPLALEGLALELTAAARRQHDGRLPEPRLESVRAMIVQDLSSPPSLSQIAREVGLHPSHLARAFRSRYGESVGEYGGVFDSSGRPSACQARRKRSRRSRRGRSPTRATSRGSSSATSASHQVPTGSRTADSTPIGTFKTGDRDSPSVTSQPR